MHKIMLISHDLIVYQFEPKSGNSCNNEFSCEMCRFEAKLLLIGSRYFKFDVYYTLKGLFSQISDLSDEDFFFSVRQ